MTTRILLIAPLFILGATQPSFATLFSSSGSTTTSGVTSFMYQWDNCYVSTSVCNKSSTADTTNIPFKFTLSLPNEPGFFLDNAALTLSLPRSVGDAAITNETSAPLGYFIKSDYSTCNFSLFGACLSETYHVTESNESYAPNLTFLGRAVAYVDKITSPGGGWSGSPTDANSLNLVNLGLGSDLLTGGNLTVSGFLELVGPYGFIINGQPGPYSTSYAEAFTTTSSLFGFIPTGSSNEVLGFSANSDGTGFNADTDFSLSYSDTSLEGGELDLDFSATPVPEPSPLSISLAGLCMIGAARYFGRHKKAVER